MSPSVQKEPTVILVIYKSKTFVLYKSYKHKKKLGLSQWYIAIAGRKNKLQPIVFETIKKMNECWDLCAYRLVQFCRDCINDLISE